VPAHGLEEVHLRLDVDVQRGGGLVEALLDEGLRCEVKDPLRLHGRDQVLDRAGVGQLAIEEGDPTFLPLVTEGLPVAVASFDDVDLLGAAERLQVLHARTPPERPVDGDIGMLGKEILGKVTSGHAGDAGNEDAHWAKNSKGDAGGRSPGRCGFVSA